MTARRGRPPKPKSATWQVGAFQASFVDGEYILRSGKSLLMRTKSEDQFKDYCALLERTA